MHLITLLLLHHTLNFAKMEWAYFAGLKFRDLAIKTKELNFAKIVKILICINKLLVSELAQLILLSIAIVSIDSEQSHTQIRKQF